MSRKKSRALRPSWTKLSDEQLLEKKIQSIALKIKGTLLEACIKRLYAELAQKNIRFRPHCWLSTEWFSPENIPGIAIPFYLAHPRLAKLEARQMLMVEGGTQNWCMRILRHEAGHAIDTAYQLHRKRKWSKVFGPSSKAYPMVYTPKPVSKNFVLHLDWWYAQSHPHEDFAETFAVWLTPNQSWRKRYHNWPALKKLKAVAELMREIAGKRPLETNRTRISPSKEIRRTLRSYYRAKRIRYGTHFPDFYDRDLNRIFSPHKNHRSHEAASAFLRRNQKEIRQIVAYGTGQHEYTIDQVIKAMITRCRTLKLRLMHSERKTRQSAIVLITAQTMNFVLSGRHRIAL